MNWQKITAAIAIFPLISHFDRLFDQMQVHKKGIDKTPSVWNINL